MSSRSGFSLAGLSRQRPAFSEDFETLLETMPHAVALVETSAWRVLLVNSKLAELSDLNRHELVGTDFRALFSDWQDLPNPESLLLRANDRNGLVETPLIRRLKRRRPLVAQGQPDLPVYLVATPTSARENHLLVTLTPVDKTPVLSGQTRIEQLWDGFQKLILSLQTQDAEVALSGLVAAGQEFSGASAVVVYLVAGDAPMLNRLTSSADFGLPEQLPLEDLTHLSRPRLWEAGKRPAFLLHRQARSAGYAWLASAPVGQPGALTGLVALADATLLPPGAATQFAQLLAGAVSIVLQQQSRAASLQQQLDWQEAQLQIMSTLEGRSNEGVLQLSPSLHIQHINPAAELILGYIRREVVGQPAGMVMIGAEALADGLAAAQLGQPTYNLGETRLYRRNGDGFQALVRIFPVFQADRLLQILVFIQDLSEWEQIRSQTQQLENRALLGEVTAIFAHEVRNPINNISTGLQLMGMNLPTEDPNQEVVGRMLQDCDRLAELIKSVLAFSRPTEYDMEPLDLPLLLHRLLERLRPRILRLNIQHSLKADPDCPLVLGNLRALEQVFNNLITNALQAMGESGGVLALRVQHITPEDEPAYLEVSITDTGPGIPKEIQERIFQPFFTTERNGTGLGLAIAKRILTAHKGNLRLSSFPGGTIFFVQMPVIYGR